MEKGGEFKVITLELLVAHQTDSGSEYGQREPSVVGTGWKPKERLSYTVIRSPPTLSMLDSFRPTELDQDVGDLLR